MYSWYLAICSVFSIPLTSVDIASGLREVVALGQQERAGRIGESKSARNRQEASVP